MMLASHLVDVELLHQIQVGALPAQVSAGHRIHSLLLQHVHHVVERVLIRQRSQGLGGGREGGRGDTSRVGIKYKSARLRGCLNRLLGRDEGLLCLLVFECAQAWVV